MLLNLWYQTFMYEFKLLLPAIKSSFVVMMSFFMVRWGEFFWCHPVANATEIVILDNMCPGFSGCSFNLTPPIILADVLTYVWHKSKTQIKLWPLSGVKCHAVVTTSLCTDSSVPGVLAQSHIYTGHFGVLQEKADSSSLHREPTEIMSTWNMFFSQK